jgi:hypothetical protein
MKKFAAALALGLALAAGNASADAIMQSAYDNTIVVTAPSGVVLRYHFNADGTYDFVTPDAHTVPGTYTVADGQICLTPTGGQQACTQYVGDKNVGDTWTQTGADGSQISIALVAGRP